METKIQKWGNSLGVRLPKSITKLQRLEPGSSVKVSLVDDKILIEKQAISKKTLKELVKMIKPGHIASEVDWGEPRGKEIW